MQVDGVRKGLKETEKMSNFLWHFNKIHIDCIKWYATEAYGDDLLLLQVGNQVPGLPIEDRGWVAHEGHIGVALFY